MKKSWGESWEEAVAKAAEAKAQRSKEKARQARQARQEARRVGEVMERTSTWAGIAVVALRELGEACLRISDQLGLLDDEQSRQAEQDSRDDQQDTVATRRPAE